MAAIAILGYGTVGSGVYEVLKTNGESINKKALKPIEIKYVLDLRDFPGDPVESVLTHDFEEIISDDEVEVVVEVMGGIEPAYTFVKRSILKGKSVCTSNKALVAKHGAELLRLAEENNVNFLFEASVGGGIPVIRPIIRSITSDRIEEITGILNGTTNYMLTKMGDEGLEYDDVLKDAQAKGYAERNPEADVEGHDTCRKIAILASLAIGKQVNFEDIYTEGITNVSKTDIDYVKAMGKSIKLVATASISDNGVWARVCPLILEPANPLAGVSDVFNAIKLTGNMLGDVMFYGQGAGKLPTAAAVVSDIVDAVRHKNINLGIHWSEEVQSLLDVDNVEVKKLVRVAYDDKAAALASVKAVFGDTEVVDGVAEGEFAFVTSVAAEKAVNESVNKLLNSTGITDVLSSIRMEQK
jgi:homoserine dehydrogenase